MTMTDPIADMLTRIRNGQMARKSHITVPASSLKKSVLQVLAAEGYIAGYSEEQDARNHPQLSVELKYYADKPVISEIKRVSKPGLRQYSKAKDVPGMRDGLGITIITTSQGVMTDAQAREKKLGGEILCQVF